MARECEPREARIAARGSAPFISEAPSFTPDAPPRHPPGQRGARLGYSAASGALRAPASRLARQRFSASTESEKAIAA